MSIKNGDYYYDILREKDEALSHNNLSNIIKNQMYLLKKRIRIFNNISNNEFENFSFMENVII